MPYINPNITMLDGKALSEKIKKDLAIRVKALDGMHPELTIFTNSNTASQVYVRNKVRFGEDIGVVVKTVNLYEELQVFKNSYGKYSRYHRETLWSPYIIQLPLDPEVMTLYSLKNESEIFDCFDGDVDKLDMDGFNPLNIGKLVTGGDYIPPCTPAGIIRLLKEYHVPIKGKNVVILGRSNIVGKPLAHMMMREGATVTNVHRQTEWHTMRYLLKGADILVSATGDINVLIGVFEEEIPGVVVDVGMNRDYDGKLCGDIPTSKLLYCDYVTPVPGGVGPMTVAMLFENVVAYYEKRKREVG